MGRLTVIFVVGMLLAIVALLAAYENAWWPFYDEGTPPQEEVSVPPADDAKKKDEAGRARLAAEEQKQKAAEAASAATAGVPVVDRAKNRERLNRKNAEKRAAEGRTGRTESCQQMEGFQRCSGSVTGLEKPSCITDLRYTRVPRGATHEKMVDVTRRLNENVCNPQNDSDSVPNEGCWGEGEQQVCWRFRRVVQPTPT